MEPLYFVLQARDPDWRQWGSVADAVFVTREAGERALAATRKDWAKFQWAPEKFRLLPLLGGATEPGPEPATTGQNNGKPPFCYACDECAERYRTTGHYYRDPLPVEMIGMEVEFEGVPLGGENDFPL